MNRWSGAIIAILLLMSVGGASAGLGDAAPGLPTTAPPAIASSAPPWTTNVKVSDDTGSSNQVEVDLAAASSSLLVTGWVDYRTGTKCAFSVSKDGGKTWGKNFLVTSTGGGITGDSTVAADLSGNLYLICQDYGASDLKFAVSADGGNTFTPWRSITAADDKPWLRATGNGTLYLTYSSGNGQVFRRSADGGQTWTASRSLGSGVQGAAMSTSPAGLLHIAWNEGAGLSYIRSKDFGVTLETKRSLLSNMGTFCYSCTPRNHGITGMGSDPTGKYVAISWASDRSTGNEDVWVMYSDDSGDTWKGPVKANDDGGSSRQFQAWVDVDEGGVAHALWTDLRNSGQNAAYYANMTMSAGAFAGNLEVTDGRGSPPSFMGDYKAISAVGDTVFATWCDSRSGNGDIYFSSARLGKGSSGIARIEVLPAGATVPADQTLQFTATAYDQANQKVNATFAWNSSGGSITQNGLYTPQATGQFTVAAGAAGKSGSTQVTVVHGALVSITPLPADPTVKADQTVRFTAEGDDSKGNRWTVSPVTWALSGGSDAGSIDATGLFTPNKVGSYPVTVTDPASAKSGTTTVTVETGAIARIDVTPPSVTITADDQTSFTAAATDIRGNPVSATFTWTSTSGSMTSAGAFTPDKAGDWKVSAAAGAATGVADVKVTAGALASIEVDPEGRTISADDTLQFTARGLDKNGNEIASLSGLVWASTSGAISSAGLFTPDAAGSLTVSAKLGLISGSAGLTVTPGGLATVRVEPAEKVMEKGERATFVARGFDADGNEIPGTSAVWSIAGDVIGEIDMAGVLIAKAAGEATVNAKVTVGAGPTKEGTARVLVRGGLFDLKGGGFFDLKGGSPLPYVMILMVVVAAALVAAVLVRRRKKKLALSQPSAWSGPDPWNGAPGSVPISDPAPSPLAPPGPGPGGWNEPSGPPPGPG